MLLWQRGVSLWRPLAHQMERWEVHAREQNWWGPAAARDPSPVTRRRVGLCSVC